jgi:GxxExxY protein
MAERGIMNGDINDLSKKILGACIEVHMHIGPGLLESAYEEALALALSDVGLRYDRQPRLAIMFKGRRLDAHYRADFVVERAVVVELKAVEAIIPVHKAQLLTYLRASGLTLGLLINFNAPTLRGGISRVVNGAPNLPRDFA